MSLMKNTRGPYNCFISSAISSVNSSLRIATLSDSLTVNGAGSTSTKRTHGNSDDRYSTCVPGAAPAYTTVASFNSSGPTNVRNSISLRRSLRCPQCTIVLISSILRLYLSSGALSTLSTLLNSGDTQN